MSNKHDRCFGCVPAYKTTEQLFNNILPRLWTRYRDHVQKEPFLDYYQAIKESDRKLRIVLAPFTTRRRILPKWKFPIAPKASLWLRDLMMFLNGRSLTLENYLVRHFLSFFSLNIHYTVVFYAPWVFSLTVC